MLVCRSFKKVENGYNLLIKSITHDDCPVNDQYSRTEVVFQACQMRVNPENKDHTDIKIINQMNGKKNSLILSWNMDTIMGCFTRNSICVK